MLGWPVVVVTLRSVIIYVKCMMKYNTPAHHTHTFSDHISISLGTLKSSVGSSSSSRMYYSALLPRPPPRPILRFAAGVAPPPVLPRPPPSFIPPPGFLIAVRGVAAPVADVVVEFKDIGFLSVVVWMELVVALSEV